MGKILKLLGGIRVLEEIYSPVNGKIVVQTDLAWGPHILVDGLSQSGGVVKDVWKPVFRKLKNYKLNPKNCLILGLGGGTIAKFSRKNWPDAKITGVELDPLMVKMGEKYLGLMNANVETHIEDAYKLLARSKAQFDLVLVDIYEGRSVPEKFTTETFAKIIKKTLSDKGVVVFNRLYGGQNTSKAEKFLKILKKVFPEVNELYPQANVMYICNK